MNNKIIRQITEFIINNYDDIQTEDKYFLFNHFCREYKITISHLPSAVEYMNIIDDLRKIELRHLKTALEVDMHSTY